MYAAWYFHIMHADQFYVGYCMHIADKHLKCLLVSDMSDEKQTFTVFGKLFNLLWNVFSHMGFVCVAYCML